jgi:hypothetical protein
MSYKIRITDPKHHLFDQELDGGVVYYDVAHTGSSPDLIEVFDDAGKGHLLLSTQVDEDYLEQQRMDEFMLMLGASVGDRVHVLEAGSGTYSRRFDLQMPHVITGIKYAAVEFDDGAAVLSGPVVKRLDPDSSPCERKRAGVSHEAPTLFCWFDDRFLHSFAGYDIIMSSPRRAPLENAPLGGLSTH